MNEFFTWDMLGSFAGAVTAVTLITQVLKGYLAVNPKWIALVLSFLIELAVTLVYQMDFSLQAMVLMILNSFLILSSAIGVFELAVKPVETKMKG